MYAWLAEALRDSSQILTANRRLARILASEFGEQMVLSGKKAWPSPLITSWQDWLAELLATAEQQQSLPTRINGHQSRVLWERCLRREINDPLLNIGFLVRQSRETWSRLHEFCVSLDDCRRSAQGNDQRVFVRAAESYQSILDREHWVDDAGIANLVAELIRAGRVKVPARVSIAGFDRVVPQTKSVLDAACVKGMCIEDVGTTTPNANGAVRAYDNTEAEIRAAGAWARRELEEDPARRIAIVATNLEQNAAHYGRLVREGFVPGWQYAAASHRASVNVSYGRRLADYPAIAIALLALRWLYDDLTGREVSLLLRSPIIGSGDTSGRGRLELQLRQVPDRSWSPEMLLAELGERESSADARDWIDRIRYLGSLRVDLPRRDTPPSWAVVIDDTLTKLNWPGDGSLDSVEFQLINRWRELLNDLARLELVSPTLTIADALSRVTAIAGETVFQPEVEGALVQLLGPLEAAGMEFDKLWVSGLTASNWPPAGRPSSLISMNLQRSRNMPDATPQDTLDYARRVLDRLTNSTMDVVCSYPLTDGDAEQGESGLLQQYDYKLLPRHGDPGWHAATLVDAVSLTVVPADPIPTVSANEVISGGAATIQRQLTEPFAAFIFGRLGVRDIQPISFGLSASLRGNLIHDALRRLYSELPSRHDIASWDGDELEGRLAAALDKSFWRQMQNIGPVLKQLFRLEQQRVGRLLRDVVALDSTREDFEIADVEGALQPTIAGVPLRLRADRIDRLGSAEVVILDYKTGSRKAFLGANGLPKDMQLVVYAIALDAEVSDLGLVNIDSRSTSIDGAGKRLTPDLDWDDALSSWTKLVEVAAGQLQRGDVRVNGLQNMQSARPLSLISRIRELQHDN
ncbi:MAG: PD-(D/E)XK nuclease family protein [Woeseiaceae bacterium]|nr:PD-(D/E)XK nuclease family protein [Woeseiaceae bacterium]MDX2608006.1 PD-(D/E)XK nuclease family protein [Woeseiaceae bacterium]